jgi:hypothetical protein
MSKFSEFITEKKIDPRRIMSASAAIEKLKPEDRALRLAQRLKTDKKAEGERKKPRSGRPITPRAMAALLEGKPISGPQKTRLLRALNVVLEKKKQEPASLKTLF